MPKRERVYKVHKVYGPLRGALSTAAGAADKHCPKDTRDLMDLINFINLNNSFHYGKNSVYLE